MGVEVLLTNLYLIKCLYALWILTNAHRILKAYSLLALEYYVYILLPPEKLYAYQEPGMFTTNLFNLSCNFIANI